MLFYLMNPPPPKSTHTATLFPYSPLFISHRHPGSQRARLCARPAPGPGLPAARLYQSEHGTTRTYPGTLRRRRHDTADTAARGLSSREHTLDRSEEQTSELQSLMRISYAVFCLQKNTQNLNRARTIY